MSDFIDDTDVKYILKKTDYTYSISGKLMKLVERMYDDSNKETLRKTVNYYYDGNGNELSNTASWTHPHGIKLRQSTKGSLQADNIANGTDPLIDRVNNTFDGFGRLVKVERISAGVRSESTFLYNGDNLRVSKTVKKSNSGYKAEVTNYLYDRQNVILETDASNKVKTRYVKGINYVASMSTGNKMSYFLYNGHGDVVQTVNKTGEVQNNYEYDIWGNPTLTVETVECAIRYAGEFYDSETGLYYLRARYYNPYIGRFISEDSYWGEDNNPLSLNRYTYAHNDPIQYLDPTGYVVIRKGSKGKVVEEVQKKLNEIGYKVGTPDGKFGSNTDAAIRKFQKDYDLKPDGIIGKQSLAMLNAMYNNRNQPDNVRERAMNTAAKVSPGKIEDNRMPQSNKSANKPSTNANTGLKTSGNSNSTKLPSQNTVTKSNKNTNQKDVQNNNKGNIASKIVKGSVEGAADSAVGHFINKMPDTSKHIKDIPKLGVAAKVEVSTINVGTKVVKNASKIAGPVEVATYAYSIYQDIDTYDGKDAAKAVTVTTGGTLVTIAAGAAVSGVGAPVAIVILAGVAVGVAVDGVSSKIKKKWIGH